MCSLDYDEIIDEIATEKAGRAKLLYKNFIAQKTPTMIYMDLP